MQMTIDSSGAPNGQSGHWMVNEYWEWYVYTEVRANADFREGLL